MKSKNKGEGKREEWKGKKIGEEGEGGKRRERGKLSRTKGSVGKSLS